MTSILSSNISLGATAQRTKKYHNLMFEPQVVRGNTFSSNIVKKPEPIKVGAKVGPSTKKAHSNLSPLASTKGSHSTLSEITVECYNHFVNRADMSSIGCMTNPYSETLTDKPNSKSAETQTDMLLNKPSTGRRKQLPDPNMHSKGTQIVLEDGLFDFNVEVEPILSVLLTKTLEQARMEVLEEEELRIMKEQRRTFEQKKVSELAEVQRQEANERRLEEETNRRKIQSHLIQRRQVDTHKQLCARVVSKGYLKNLLQESLNVVEQIGFFEEDNLTQLYSNFLPWLYDEVFDKLDRHTEYGDLVTRMSNVVESYSVEAHIQSFYNKDRGIEKEKQLAEQKLVRRAQKRQRKIDEMARQAEEERVQKLQNYLQQTLTRPETIRNRPLLISDTHGISEVKNRSLVCLPGGLLMEMYLFFDSLKRVSEVEEYKNVVSISSKTVRNLLRTLQEHWSNQEWRFELGYRFDPAPLISNLQASYPAPEEKKEEIDQLERLKASGNILEILGYLKQIGQESVALEVAAEVCSSLTFYLRELFHELNPSESRPHLKTQPGAEEDGTNANPPAVAPVEKPEPKKNTESTKSAAEIDLDFPNATIKTEFSKFDPSVLLMIEEGLMKYIVQEEKDKVSKILNFVKYERDFSNDARQPTLVKMRPIVEEERKQDSDEQDEAQKTKNDYVERPWRVKLNPSLANEKKALKFHQLKYEQKATVCAPLTENHNVLIQHLALGLQIKKDLIMAGAPLAGPKLFKDKPSSLKLLDVMATLGESLEKTVTEGVKKPQDVFVFNSY